jgi:aspartate aminotransferase
MAVADKIHEMMERSSWIRKMFETGAQLKAKYGADRVCDFSLGNPNLEPPVQFRERLIELAAEAIPVKHGYMPNAGYVEVRQRIAEFVSGEQGTPLQAQHIIMTCGAGGALNVALKTILNPGDEVVAVTPCFMEYRFYADNHGGILRLVPCGRNFDLFVPAIRENIGPKTAAVIINTPNNPSGAIYPESTLVELGGVLREKSAEIGRDIYLVCDEPYRKIVYDGIRVPSIFSAYSNSIIATSYSKDLSIPGERIGFLAVHPAAADAENLVNGMILCNRILGFVNAPALMQRIVGDLQGACVDVDRYREKRDILCQGLSSIGYEFVKPQGTFYLFPKSPTDNDMEIVDALRRERILTVPGRGFSYPGYFRIAYCVEDEVIKRSLEGFAKAYNAVTN